MHMRMVTTTQDNVLLTQRLRWSLIAKLAVAVLSVSDSWGLVIKETRALSLERV